MSICTLADTYMYHTCTITEIYNVHMDIQGGGEKRKEKEGRGKVERERKGEGEEGGKEGWKGEKGGERRERTLD